MSLLLFAIMIQGAFHLFLWCMLFLLVLAVGTPSHRKPFLITLAVSGLLCSFRIVPATIAYWSSKRAFISGYPTLRELFDGLTAIRDDTFPALGGTVGVLGWWEYDAYLGLLGFAAVLYFGVYLSFRKDPRLEDCRYEQLWLPVGVLTLFSLSYFYVPIAYLPLPLAACERVPTRFLTVPLVMIVLVACIRMERLLPALQRRPLMQVLAVLALLETAFSLATHSHAWRLASVETHFVYTRDTRFAAVLRQLAQGGTVIAQQPLDRFYIRATNIAVLVSLCTLVCVVPLLVWRWVTARRKAVPEGAAFAAKSTARPAG